MQMEIPQLEMVFVRAIVSVSQPMLLVILPEESDLKKENFKIHGFLYAYKDYKNKYSF